MEQLKVTLTGVSPLMMHSSVLSNPMHPLTKEHKALTSKRKKTDEDHEAIAKSEWTASMYMDPQMGPYIPAMNIEATIMNGAKQQKLGTKFKSSVMVLEDKVPLQYNGPRNFEGLWGNPNHVDLRGVKVMAARIQRCRPVFPEWKVQFTLAYNPAVLDKRDIQKAVEDSGVLVGLCEGRPRFGKFTVDIK